ncbi:MAG: aspartate--tRNA ligase, partial [Mycobacteriaceae bacterium]
MIRTHAAGTLRAEHVGQTVTLTGWVARRRDHGGVAFLDLRDASGVVQVVVRDEEVAGALRSEYCLKVVGKVSGRPAGNQNSTLPTGEVEVVADEVDVLSASAPLPFPIDDTGHGDGEVGEEARLKYRYLDLRRSGPNAALRLRSKVNKAARDVLDHHDFVEIETPTLTRSTPEGARDFLVPARLRPGSWYALPQSPQLFKQLLMVAGMERYYQIARCYRDEDFRADRQPEFTQLDIEMSFVEQDDVMALMEELIGAMWALIGYDVPTPLHRMTYAEAMARFGSDKPDLRMGLELVECTDYFKDTPFRVFKSEYVGAVVMPGGASQPRRQLDAWQEWAKQRGARGLAYVLVQEDGGLTGPVAKYLSELELAGIAAHVGAKPGDCIFFAAGAVKSSRALLGAARLEIGHRCDLIDKSAWRFLWVTDAPLFEPADEATAAGDVAVGGGAWTAVHHAFTSPQDLATFDTDPGNALAWAYDIVCNGNELGGGSIRIHRGDIQRRVFAVMGIDEAEAQEKFGFLLDAFSFGAPPHGGIAVGMDRIC